MNIRSYLRKQIAIASALLVMLMPVFATAQANVVAAPLSVAASATNGMVRVYLMSIASKTTLNVTANGSYSINGNVNQALFNGESLKVSINTATGNITLTRNGTATNMGTSFGLRRHATTQSGGILIAESLNASNPYPGDMLFTAQLQGGAYKLYAIANVFIEDYLYGVLPYEMGNSANIEALKAQAVAARTYTLSKMKARSGSLYDVVDNTNDQVYRGTPTGNDNCKSAVDATRGVVLMSGNSLVETYYTASNGGQTESSLNAWGSARSYLTVKDDPFDLANSDAEVRKTTVYSDFSNASQNGALKSLLTSKANTALQNMGYSTAGAAILQITSVVPHTPKYPKPSSLYTYVDFFVTAQVKAASGALSTVPIQLTCGIFSELESALSMSIQSSQNELWSVSKSGSNFVLAARRFGHGIGLSQRGAMQMGRLGYGYAEILGFYFTGAKRMQNTFTNTILSPISPSGSTEIVEQVDPAQLEGDDSGCTGTVNLVNKQGTLGIYSQMSTSASAIGAIPNAAPVKIYAIKNGWCFVSYGQIYGYVLQSGLTITGTAPEETDLKPSVISEYAVVTANGYLNLRQSGSSTATILGTAPEGAVLSVFSKTNGWAYIGYGALTAYASTSFLTFHQTYPVQVSDPAQNAATVTLADQTQTVNMRASASLSGSVIAQIANGTQVTLIKDDGSWAEVSYGGQTGYIMSSYLVVSGTAAPPDTQTQAPTPTPPPAKLTARANGPQNAVPVFDGPNDSGNAVDAIANGTRVTVIEYGQTWCYVQAGEVMGYVKTALLLFGEDPQAALTATVTTQSGSLNLRSKASAGSTILLTIPRLATVTVHEKGDTWTHITYNGVTGYVMTMYLTIAGDTQSPPEPTLTPEPTLPPTGETGLTATVVTVSGSLNLRQAADATADILTTIPRGTILSVLEKGDAWSRVQFGGLEGYVMNSFLVFDKPDQPTQTPEPSLAPEEPGEMGEPTPTPTPIPTDAAPSKVYATVVTASGSLNMRESMSTGSTVVVVIPRGTTIEVLEGMAAWSNVTYRGYIGYVLNTYLSFDAQAPATNDSAQTAKVVTTSGALNLRATAMVANNVIAQIPQNGTVQVHDRGVNWCYVAYNGVHGYVMTQYLAFDEGSPIGTTPPSATSARVFTQNGGSLNIREAPNGTVISTIPNGQTVEVAAQSDGWSKVKYNGVEGYVMSSYLVFAQGTNTPAPTQTLAPTVTPAPTEKEQETQAPNGATPTPTSTPTPEPTLTPTPIPEPEPTPTPTPKATVALDNTLEDLLEDIAVMPIDSGDFISVYKECSLESGVAFTIGTNESFFVTQKGDTWCKVRYLEQVGYVKTQEIAFP